MLFIRRERSFETLIYYFEMQRVFFLNGKQTILEKHFQSFRTHFFPKME